MFPSVRAAVLSSNARLVTLSGEIITGSGEFGRAGVRVNTDGTVDKRVVATYSQIDSATDWMIPNDRAEAVYEVRVTNVVWTDGTAFEAAAAADDVWIALSSNREWYVHDTDSGVGGKQDVTFDLEIRFGSAGATLASASYQLVSDYDTT